MRRIEWFARRRVRRGCAVALTGLLVSATALSGGAETPRNASRLRLVVPAAAQQQETTQREDAAQQDDAAPRDEGPHLDPLPASEGVARVVLESPAVARVVPQTERVSRVVLKSPDVSRVVPASAQIDDGGQRINCPHPGPLPEGEGGARVVPTASDKVDDTAYRQAAKERAIKQLAWRGAHAAPISVESKPPQGTTLHLVQATQNGGGPNVGGSDDLFAPEPKGPQPKTPAPKAPIPPSEPLPPFSPAPSTPEPVTPAPTIPVAPTPKSPAPAPMAPVFPESTPVPAPVPVAPTAPAPRAIAPSEVAPRLTPIAPTGPAPNFPNETDAATGERLNEPTANGGPAMLEVLGTNGELTVTRRRNKILRSRDNIYRVAVVDPAICDVVQFTPREVSIIGRGQGATSVTFWFTDGEHRPVTYLVRVVPDPEVQVERERQYEIFEEVLAELFPDSKVSLTPVADKLIVRGEAKDAEEAAEILTVIRGEALAGRRGNGGGNGNWDGGGNTLVDGQAASPLSSDATGNPLPASNIVNMLRIPGVQQVALRVKIAELNRSAARNFGVNFKLDFDVGSSGSLVIQSLLNTPGTASILGSFNDDQINFGIHYLKKHGVLRILSEPTLVTLSGRPASFVAGGEFAVPTTVGVDGAAAVTTDFRSFGVILNFLPTVLDKDRMRLDISPEFSKINNDLTVNDTPGLTTRAVTTTVEMREGQTLAIAGLLEDSMDASKTEDIPWLSTILGRRSITRNETELIILVTPELVHPLDPEEVPPLPGFDVTEPSDAQFFLAGKLEGTPTQDYRSTVWPRLKNRYRHGGPAMISGPFGHGQ